MQRYYIELTRDYPTGARDVICLEEFYVHEEKSSGAALKAAKATALRKTEYQKSLPPELPLGVIKLYQETHIVVEVPLVGDAPPPMPKN